VQGKGVYNPSFDKALLDFLQIAHLSIKAGNLTWKHRLVIVYGH